MTKEEHNYNLDWPGDDFDKAATELERGTIVRDWFVGSVRCLIMRGPFSFTAYLGIPEDHPMAGFQYDDVPLSVHGGLTFSNKILSGMWFYGWDYAHAGDVPFYYVKDGLIYPDGHKWTIDEIAEEVDDALYYFTRLVNVAEASFKKDRKKK